MYYKSAQCIGRVLHVLRVFPPGKIHNGESVHFRDYGKQGWLYLVPENISNLANSAVISPHKNFSHFAQVYIFRTRILEGRIHTGVFSCCAFVTHSTLSCLLRSLLYYMSLCRTYVSYMMNEDALRDICLLYVSYMSPAKEPQIHLWGLYYMSLCRIHV